MSRRESGAGASRGRAKGRSDREASDAPKPKDDEARSKLPGGLYLVATPIGNAADITLRALDILGRADVVACEDTRLTGKLLARHGIHARLTPYHDHNAERARPALLERLARGESIALVSDAGTPLLSDPGYKLVKACRESGLAVTAAPGPSAAIAALILSALPTDRFLFAGFLPAKAAARTKTLVELASVPATLVFYESPSRLADSLADMAKVLGDRPAAVARELTKLFEELRRGSLGELSRHYAESGAPKGEVVVVVGGPMGRPEPETGDIDDRLREALKRQSVRDAAALIAAETGLSRRDIYGRALLLARGGKTGA